MPSGPHLPSPSSSPVELRVTRRRLLAGLGAALTASTAGCAAVYVGGSDSSGRTSAARLFVLDRRTGEELTGLGLGENANVHTSPAVVDGVVFVATSSGTLRAVVDCDAAVEGHCLF